MNLVGFLSTAVLSLTLVAAAPVYAQEQHEQQEEKKAKPEEKKAQQEKPEAQQQKNNKPEEKKAQQEKREPAQQAQRGGGGRIPEDRFKANFGQEHRFHVNQADYNNGRRFQYSGYWFTFVDPWPSNWLYTQDVFVVEINGVYYLCNPMYPGVNITLGFAQ